MVKEAGMATSWKAGGSIDGKGKIFLFSTASRQALKPTQPI
jgi:hypothetical protein